MQKHTHILDSDTRMYTNIHNLHGLHRPHLLGSPLLAVEMLWLEFDASDTVPISHPTTVPLSLGVYRLLYKNKLGTKRIT